MTTIWGTPGKPPGWIHWFFAKFCAQQRRYKRWRMGDRFNGG